jgi:hypothetical protein
MPFIMKKQLLFIFLILLVRPGFCQVVLPNGDFENWVEVQGSGPDSTYWIPGGGFFATLNELAWVPQNPGPITAYRTTDSHTGSYAILLVSKNYPSLPIFIPGMMGDTKLLIAQSTIKLGKPCPYGCDPKHFTGWFKYYPVNGDSCKFAALVSHYNTATHHRDTIAYGDTLIKATVTTYTQFDIPVKPVNLYLSPDSLTILTVSSGAFNITNLTGGHGQPGSTLYIDDLSVVYPEGIQQMLMPEVTVNTYPDPAADNLTIELSKKVNNGILEVYNLQGKLMEKLSLSDNKTTVSVSHLPSGTYYYKLTVGINVINTGSFVVRR